MSVISPPQQRSEARSALAASVPFWEAVRLVAGREMLVRLRDKMFLITTGFFMLLAISMTLAPQLLANDSSTVAVAAPGAQPGLERAGIEVRETDAADAMRLVRAGEVDAAVVATPVEGVKVVAMDDAPQDVVRALSAAPPVQLLDPEAVDPALRFLVPMAFAMIFSSPRSPSVCRSLRASPKRSRPGSWKSSSPQPRCARCWLASSWGTGCSPWGRSR